MEAAPSHLDTGKLAPYWANTSSNALVSKLIREAGPDVKSSMEGLLEGGSVSCIIDEQIVFSMLGRKRRCDMEPAAGDGIYQGI